MKRILAFLFIFLMIFQSAVCADGISQQKAINKVLSLSIMEGHPNNAEGEFLPDEPMTKLDFVISLVKTMSNKEGLEKLSQDTPFVDVTASFWASGYINEALRLGIVDTQSLNFYPTKTLSYEEAVRILVDALGYKSYADIKGGFPLGYVITAHELGLDNDLSLSNTASLTRGDGAVLLANAIDAEVLDVISMTNGEPGYSVAEGVTILSRGRDIHKSEGVIMANEFTSLIGVSPAGKGMVAIGDKYYYTGSTSVSTLLGSNVTFYYKNENNKNTIVYFEENTEDTTKLKLYPADISLATRSRVVYYENNRTREMRISSTAKVVYNGKYLGIAANLDNARLSPASGYIELIDNTGDKLCDAIIIHNEQTYIVGEVFAQAGIIADKTGVNTFNVYASDKTVKVYKDGAEADLSQVAENNVITAETSEDGKLCILNVSGKSVSGKIEEIKENTIRIENIYYDLNKDMYPDPAVSISAGKKANVYMDIHGRAAYVEYTQDVLTYGYICDVKKDIGLSTKTQIMLFSSDNEFKYLYFTDNTSVDGYTCRNYNEIIAKLSVTKPADSDDDVDGICQPIKYKVNDENQVTYIDTLANNKVTSDDDLECFAPRASRHGQVAFTITMLSSTTKSIVRFAVNSSTLVFDIPSDKSDYDSYDVKPYSYFKHEGTYTVSAYDAENLGTASLCIIDTGGSGSVGTFDPKAEATVYEVVEKVTMTTDKDGFAVKTLHTVAGSRRSTYELSDSTRLVRAVDVTSLSFPSTTYSVDNLAPGDVVALEADAKNRVIYVYKIFPMTMNVHIGDSPAELLEGYSDWAEYAFGRVTSKKGSEINVEVNDGLNVYNAYYCFNSNTRVLKYNSRLKTVVAAKADDIVASSDNTLASKVFIRTRYGNVKEVVIYE